MCQEISRMRKRKLQLVFPEESLVGYSGPTKIEEMVSKVEPQIVVHSIDRAGA